MNCIAKPKTILPFLFVGCWNRDDKPRNSVTKSITDNPIQTVILGGDNIYPQKLRIGNNTEFTKVYSTKTLMNGIHRIKGKDIYATLGNHNIGNSMLNTQLGLNEWTMPSRYYCVYFSDCALIVIDSNLVTTDKYEEMRDWLTEQVHILKKKGMKYFYVQHEPFIAFKKNKVVVLPHTDELIHILAEYKPEMILCADTHNYQKGILKIGDKTMTQYVVGTGGASPDIVKAKIGDEYTIDGIRYIMEDYIPGYGYLEVSTDETKFIKVSDWRPFEGIGGKRTRSKNKGLKRYKKTLRKYNNKC